MENDAVISCIKRTRICYRSWLVELTHGWYRLVCLHTFARVYAVFAFALFPMPPSNNCIQILDKR